MSDDARRDAGDDHPRDRDRDRERGWEQGRGSQGRGSQGRPRRPRDADGPRIGEGWRAREGERRGDRPWRNRRDAGDGRAYDERSDAREGGRNARDGRPWREQPSGRDDDRGYRASGDRPWRHRDRDRARGERGRDEHRTDDAARRGDERPRRDRAADRDRPVRDDRAARGARRARAERPGRAPGRERAAARAARPSAPPLSDDIKATQLDAAARRDLRGLQKETAEVVARHLVAAGRALEDDPELALEHARYARQRASRIAVVREAAGIAAYRAGEWAEALNDLRAARRMGGGPGHLAVMADIERALGRPERAIELGRSPEVKQLTRAEAIELLIVVAGARRDLGEHDAAVVTLQIPELDPARRDPWSARLFYAYADNLLAAGRTSDAIQWFVHAYDADEDDETDAAERIAELTGEPLDQVEVDFLPDEVDEDADSAGAQPDDARPDDARPDDAEREDAEREPDSASEGSDEHDSSAEDSAQPKGDADASADEVVSPDPAGSSPDSVAADQPDAEPSPTAPDTGNRVGRPDPVGSAPVTEPAQLPATTAAGVAAAPARPSEEESAP